MPFGLCYVKQFITTTLSMDGMIFTSKFRSSQKICKIYDNYIWNLPRPLENYLEQCCRSQEELLVKLLSSWRSRLQFIQMLIEEIFDNLIRLKN